ncbi:arp2/3 complex-activating protein rickA-like [Oryza brachyantha]|uniref:arp2/3 complex-activating protein rickA-like n=1 Tax=Oryza brachyantha TaxID=4533 RepID=UPI001ADCBCF0|nr:arp2/3 complex-activating protein rickA-like [Oryza brachyantha]
MVIAMVNSPSLPILAAIAASVARTTPSPLLRDAAATARGWRPCLHRPPTTSAARRAGVWCSGTTPPEVPTPTPAEVPGPDRSLEELPNIDMPPEFNPPPGLDVPMPPPGTPKPGPELPGPSIPSPPVPEVPNVPRNPDVPPPQPPDVGPPRPPPEVVPEQPPPDVEPPSFIV